MAERSHQSNIKTETFDEPGVKLLEEWIDMETKVTDSVKETWGTGALNGIVLRK